MTHSGLKVERRGLPLWVYWVAGVIVLFQPVNWSLSGIFDRGDLRSWMLLGCTGISLLAYGQALRWIRFSVAPLMFVFLFLVAYLARVPLVEANIDLWTIAGGHTSVGGFSFSIDAYKTYYVVSLVGLAGLLFGSWLGLCLNRNRRVSFSWDGNRWFRNLPALCMTWMVLSFGISLICFYLKIGLSGIDQPRLPLHLTGLLNFLRMFILPVTGWFLFGLAYDRRANGISITLLAFQMILGLASVYFTLSKAGLIYAIAPLLLYLALRAPRRAFTWKLSIGAAVAMLLLLPITYFGAMVLREEAYTDLQGDRKDGFRRIVSDHMGDESSAVGLLQGTLASLMGRVTGGSELMAVTAARPYPYASVFSLVAGNGADPDFGGPAMFLDIYNVQLIHEDGKFSGKAFGLFGGLFLSHSCFLVFIGSALSAGFVVWMELYSQKLVNQSFACGLAFWITLNLWESTFDNLKFYPPILFCLFVTVHLIRRRHFNHSSTGINAHHSAKLSSNLMSQRPHA